MERCFLSGEWTPFREDTQAVECVANKENDHLSQITAPGQEIGDSEPTFTPSSTGTTPKRCAKKKRRRIGRGSTSSEAKRPKVVQSKGTGIYTVIVTQYCSVCSAKDY